MVPIMRHMDRKPKQRMEGSVIVVKKLCFFVLLILTGFGAVKLSAVSPPPSPDPAPPLSTNSFPSLRISQSTNQSSHPYEKNIPTDPRVDRLGSYDPIRVRYFAPARPRWRNERGIACLGGRRAPFCPPLLPSLARSQDSTSRKMSLPAPWKGRGVFV